MNGNTIRSIDNFQRNLIRAIELAKENPNPSIQEKKEVKKILGYGITNGQYEVVIRAYNSTRKRINYLEGEQAK